MSRKTLISILIFSFTILFISYTKAQNFERIIEPNFKGKLKYCLSIRESYFFIGNFDSLTNKQLLLYKTDSNGNVLIKNTKINILHKLYSYAYDDSFILIADSNRLLKIDTNLNLVWIKNIPFNSYVQRIKSINSRNFLIDINNQIVILDTAGNIIRPSINYTDELSDFDLVNDTLFTLSARINNTSNNYESIITKYSKNNTKILEKKLTTFSNSYPKLLIINKNSYQLLSSDGKYFGYNLQTIFLNDTFLVTNTYTKSVHNFELTNFKYNNKSLLTYWYNDKFTINKINQLSSTLETQSSYSNSIYNFFDFFTTDKGNILIIDESGFIIKFKGKSVTGINELNKTIEPIFSPNPFIEKTTLKIDKNQDCILYVFDITGNLIVNKFVEINEEITIYSNELPSKGVYIYKLDINNKFYTGKIVY